MRPALTPAIGEDAMIECRQYPRIPVDLQVFFSTTGNTDIREGTMFDLSLGGCAVTTMTSVHPGTGMRILIRATDLGSPITIESAAVRWSRYGEFGVEFMGISDIDQSRLSRLLQASTSYPIRPS
jgi:c-di-GMP-binding flagellar brake protein YcgR